MVMVSVVVMIVVLHTIGQLFHGNHAVIDRGTANVLELDGGVADMEVIFQLVIEAGKNHNAL